MRPQDIIDYANFPLDQPDSQAYCKAVQQVRVGLAADGCSVIKNFLSAQGLAAILGEAEERKAKAYYAPKKICNIYLGQGNREEANDHPQNHFMERTNGFITSDLLGEGTAAHSLYHWPPLRKFLADCLGKDELFIYADPVSNMIINVAEKGQQFNWHFDTNEFTITFLLKAALEGGHFEYVPNLRSAEDECIKEVKQVLAGDRSRVKRLRLTAGDLQFFLGRYSLHQVTANEADSERLLLIQSFCEEDGVTGNPFRVKDLYGKTTAVHEQSRNVSDKLLD
jgi:hypothetical protein